MSTYSATTNSESDFSQQKIIHYTTPKTSFLSGFFASTFIIFESYVGSFWGGKRETNPWRYKWTTAVYKILYAGSVQRLQGLMSWTRKPDVLNTTSDIWLLGICYKVIPEESTHTDRGLAAFSHDFSSRIWMTYRSGFDAISDSKFTNDVHWGCMIRSSQMLVAEALVFHHLGRSWRRPLQKPYDPQYIDILHLFGDSVASAFSIHNLLQAGRAYGLAAGSWVGPYAICRTWEAFASENNKQGDLVNRKVIFPMTIYVVSDNENGEQGGAPVICIERIVKLCHEISKGEITWSPVLLLIPLVLGLEKVDPRYFPSLRDTFTFPQSLGILGGKPGASTYIVGVQDEKALYLDPHEVQSAIDIRKQDVEADTSSYHCNIVRHLPLDQMDSSLAIGFYCRDKGDFEDFCSRASELRERTSGAPLFTVAQSLQSNKTRFPKITVGNSQNGIVDDNNMKEAYGIENGSPSGANVDEGEWQIL
ncbi:uncharacterized protein A4U43_C04F7750 [Asparagus officinalis]|uniref:Cysteine protease n=1 Tax=Asparagus officinalis TaxID=4686 RepID=A0A5P1F3Z9_ASPOF|nr:cysteine protease ATG4B-like [Asparagus officinalis]XP_020260443.1 cysteine protease ATG4B-like [Asparagus officinalis]ONK71361.1 uncharacterized protein A4U43_C04F7750 [Asparagus officinalis]